MAKAALSPSKKPAAVPPAITAHAAPSLPPEKAGLRALALADPLLLEARRMQAKGEAPAATYDLACETWDQANATAALAYDPPPDLFNYLHSYWSDLLLEGEEERAKAGRPSLLTPSLLDAIATAADAGLKDPQIYQKLRIKQRTWSGWLSDPEGELNRTLQVARAELAQRLLRDIALMPKAWQAGVWILTQLFPEDYTRPNAETTVTVSATASASASAQATNVVTKEKVQERQARTRRKLEHQLKQAQIRADTTFARVAENQREGAQE